jgi:hypothetical protein
VHMLDGRIEADEALSGGARERAARAALP